MATPRKQVRRKKLNNVITEERKAKAKLEARQTPNTEWEDLADLSHSKRQLLGTITEKVHGQIMSLKNMGLVPGKDDSKRYDILVKSIFSDIKDLADEAETIAKMHEGRTGGIDPTNGDELNETIQIFALYMTLEDRIQSLLVPSLTELFRIAKETMDAHVKKLEEEENAGKQETE